MNPERPQPRVDGDEDFSFEEIHLRDYLEVVYRNIYLVGAVLAVAITTVSIANLAMTPLYRATSKVIVQEESGEKFDFQVSGYRRYWREMEFFQTQLEVLKSRPVVEEVVRRLELHKRPRPKPGVLGTLKNTILGFFSSSTHQPLDPQSRELRNFQAAVADLSSRLSFRAVRDTTVIDISCEHPDPLLARKIANTTADVFSSLSRQFKVKEVTNAHIYLSSRLEEIKEKLIISENELKKFQEEKEAISLDRRIDNLTEENIRVLNDLNNLERDLAEKESFFSTLEEQTREVRKKYATGDVGTFSGLKQRYLEKELELSKLMRDYTDKHPKVQNLKREMALLKKQLDSQKKLLMAGKSSTVRGIESTLERFNKAKQEMEGLKAKKLALKNVLKRTKQSLRELLRLKSQYTLLLREVQSNQKLYEMILLRQKEAGLKEAMQISDVKILERAITPLRPVKPRRLLNLVLGAIVGLFLGVGLAFLVDYFDTTLKTKDQIQRLLGLPVLGVLVAGDEAGDEPDKLARVVTEDPSSQVTEAFRSLRTTLKYVASQSPKCILVTSSGPSEGKTTVATNLAQVFAQAGEKVLIIDTDLRKPRIEKIFSVPRTPGLTDCEDLDFAALASETSIDGLSVLACGTKIQNPAEFLHLAGGKIVEKVAERYDRIIFDSPPVNAVADPVILSKFVDSVLFVISAGTATRDGVLAAREVLCNVNANVIGLVINNLRAGGPGGYYDYYHRYYGEITGYEREEA